MENPIANFQLILALSLLITISETNHLTVTTPENIAALNLPNSGEFSVCDINYLKQEIQIYDPLGCLPDGLMTLYLSSPAPFTASYYRNYTFLKCSPEVAVPRSSATIMAASSLSIVREMNMCTIMFEKAIPVTWPDRNDSLAGDLTLSWNIPGCADCEKKGNFCGFANVYFKPVYFHRDELRFHQDLWYRASRRLQGSDVPSSPVYVRQSLIVLLVIGGLVSAVSVLGMVWFCCEYFRNPKRIRQILRRSNRPEGPAAIA